MINRIRFLLAATLLSIVIAGPANASVEEDECVHKKWKATTKYQETVATCRLKYYTGKLVDVNSCILEAESKLEAAFGKAQLGLGYNCTGEDSVAELTAPSNYMIQTLALSLKLHNASSAIGLKCAASKFKALFKYARAVVACNSKDLDGGECTLLKHEKLLVAFQKAELKAEGACYTTNDVDLRSDFLCAQMDSVYTDQLYLIPMYCF